MFVHDYDENEVDYDKGVKFFIKNLTTREVLQNSSNFNSRRGMTTCTSYCN